MNEMAAEYQRSVVDVVSALSTDASRGLTATEARARRAQYGPNELRAERPVPAWHFDEKRNDRSRGGDGERAGDDWRNGVRPRRRSPPGEWRCHHGRPANRARTNAGRGRPCKQCLVAPTRWPMDRAG